MAIIGFGCENESIGWPPEKTADSRGSADNEKIEEGDDSASVREDSGDKIESIYTDIKREKCKTIENEPEKLSLVYECEGVAGYKLEVDEYDGRQTINVIYPNGKKHELNFHKVVFPSFSYVG